MSKSRCGTRKKEEKKIKNSIRRKISSYRISRPHLESPRPTYWKKETEEGSDLWIAIPLSTIEENATSLGIRDPVHITVLLSLTTWTDLSPKNAVYSDSTWNSLSIRPLLTPTSSSSHPNSAYRINNGRGDAFPRNSIDQCHCTAFEKKTQKEIRTLQPTPALYDDP